MSDAVKKAIKFSFSLSKPDKVTQDNFVELEKWRVILFQLGFMGINRNSQMSFGNISKKIMMNDPRCEIVITGSQTGQYAFLKVNQYTKIIKCDLERLKVNAVGPIAPSNQSLLHFLIYKQDPKAKFVIMIEKDVIFDDLESKNIPIIGKNILFNDEELSNILKISNIQSNIGLFLVKSSKKRIVLYSDDIDSIGKYIMELNKQYKSY
jgi:hypothetical protein